MVARTRPSTGMREHDMVLTLQFQFHRIIIMTEVVRREMEVDF